MLMCDASSPDEVDFERNPTGLYIAIHTKNWGIALDRVSSYPREAGIWVMRMDDGKGSNVVMSSPRAREIPTSPRQRVVRWRMLPLHAAVLFGAPVPLVKAIIKANPNANSSPDDQGMIPLHLAFRAGASEEVVLALLESCPEAIEMVDYKGRLPSMLEPKHSMSYADTIAEAFIRGPSQYYWSARVSSADRTRTQQEVAAKIKKFEEANQQQIRMSDRLLEETQHELTEEIEALSVENIELKERTAFYEAKYDGAEEKERVLVDHTNSLAERLRLTSLSEEHLATKLAKVEYNLKKKDAELEQMHTKSHEEKTVMQTQMQNMAKDLAKAERQANQITLSLAKKNDECDKLVKQFEKERELFEKQVEASKECLLELIASSKEDKKKFECDSKELRQHLASIQSELKKANEAPIELERHLESRLMDMLNAQKEQQQDHRHQDQSLQAQPSPGKYTQRQQQQARKPVSPKKKYSHKKGLGLEDFDEYIAETYKVQSRDDDDVVSIDSDIDTAALGDLSPEQQEALINLDLSGSSAEVARALKQVPGLTDNQVTLLLQVASSLAA